MPFAQYCSELQEFFFCCSSLFWRGFSLPPTRWIDELSVGFLLEVPTCSKLILLDYLRCSRGRGYCQQKGAPCALKKGQPQQKRGAVCVKKADHSVHLLCTLQLTLSGLPDSLLTLYLQVHRVFDRKCSSPSLSLDQVTSCWAALRGLTCGVRW